MNKYNFWVNPDINMKEIKDSMQLDSRQTIATLEDNHHSKVYLDVVGSVRIWWNPDGGNPYDGELFCTPSSFPKELKKLIAENDRWYEDERLYICENNWFEVFIDVPTVKYQFESTLVDPEGMSNSEIKDLLNRYLRAWKPEILENQSFEKAKAYAKASLYYYFNGDLNRAARYWHKIYSLKHISSEDLIKTVSVYPDVAVFNITEYIKEISYCND